MGRLTNIERNLIALFQKAGIPATKITRGSIGPSIDTSFVINGQWFDFHYDYKIKEWSIQTMHLLSEKDMVEFIKGLPKRHLGAYRFDYEDEEEGFIKD